MAIQFEKPDNPDLIVTRLGRLHVYPFVAREYARLYGVPSSLADLRNHRIVQQITPQIDENAYARAMGVESIAGIVGIRTNSSTATLYAVERGAGVGMLPTCSIALGAPLVAVDVGFRNQFDLWLTYHPDLKRSEKHMVVVEWLKRIFSASIYACFRDDSFIPMSWSRKWRPRPRQWGCTAMWHRYRSLSGSWRGDATHPSRPRLDQVLV